MFLMFKNNYYFISMILDNTKKKIKKILFNKENKKTTECSVGVGNTDHAFYYHQLSKHIIE